MREGCPFSQARCQHGQEENTASPTGLITELLGQEAPPDNHQCSNPARSLTALLVNTIVLFCLFDLEACIPVTAVELENKGLKASTISVASSSRSKNVCGTMESRKSGTRAAFRCGLLLLITDLGSPALLVVTHQCPLIKHRHGFSYHNLHGLCCASSWSHFLLWK